MISEAGDAAGAGLADLAAGAVGHPGQQRVVHPVGEHGGLARGEGDQVGGLVLGEVHRGADRLAVVGGGEPVHDLDGGVLDHVGDELGGDLLGDDQALAVGADLGQQPGEHLDRVRGRAVGRALGLAEQPVGFLEDRQVPQPRRGGAFGALPHPQVLDQADQHGAHQEGLVPVIAGVLDLQHHVAVQQPGEVQRMAALEEPAGGALAQAGDPHRDKPADVVGDLAAVADVVYHLHRGGLQVLQRRVTGLDARAGGLAGHQVPAGVLIAPGQGRRQDLRKRLAGLERGQEQGPNQVGVGLQREPRAIWRRARARAG